MKENNARCLSVVCLMCSQLLFSLKWMEREHPQGTEGLDGLECAAEVPVSPSTVKGTEGNIPVFL